MSVIIARDSESTDCESSTQHGVNTVYCRCGGVAGSELAAILGLQRIAMVPRCARETSSLPTAIRRNSLLAGVFTSPR